LTFEFDVIHELERLTMNVIPIAAADAVSAARLPMHHRDPFDRLLVAQAHRLAAVLVTRDEILERYGVEILSA